ncbi:uncharacterized protein PgNI_00083 [Pyricularia grisea]|uniref:Uncharacterized protein n=1 Tax=Pyricularia grisea TaxID=148305 RepID=A0A6P8BMH6_PYRGI|nr:uncharacterized protein PgNI_00083 [Pyricularia grisea]TLD17879.1 hypothetical protein PgNI_00083 [Pyricularia grisea]
MSLYFIKYGQCFLFFINPKHSLNFIQKITIHYYKHKLNIIKINRVTMSTRPDTEPTPTLRESRALKRKHKITKINHCRKLTLEQLPPEILFIIFEYVFFSHTQDAPLDPTEEQDSRFQVFSARCVWLPGLIGTRTWEEQTTQTALLTTNRFLSACARRVLSSSRLRGQVDVDVMWVGTSGIWPTVLSPTACYRPFHRGKEAATVEVLTVSVRLFDDPAGLNWSLTGWGRFLPIPKGEAPPAAGQADRVVFCPPFSLTGYYHSWGDFGDSKESWPKGWARPDDLGVAEMRRRLWMLPWEGTKVRARIAAADKVANFLCMEFLKLMRRDEGLGELGDGLEKVEFKVGGVLRRAVNVSRK